jgi:hypothetical protein
MSKISGSSQQNSSDALLNQALVDPSTFGGGLNENDFGPRYGWPGSGAGDKSEPWIFSNDPLVPVPDLGWPDRTVTNIGIEPITEYGKASSAPGEVVGLFCQERPTVYGSPTATPTEPVGLFCQERPTVYGSPTAIPAETGGLFCQEHPTVYGSPAAIDNWKCLI